MPEWHSCIVFSISVFHAYGHQWMCQLWYHPWKLEIWGLSDGEGCERFWSELWRLIPSLRVTGYHQQLFIIDLQVEHIDELKQQGLVKWLHDHTLSANKQEVEAMARLNGWSISYLLDQFKAQQAFQSKLMPRQLKTKGAHAIEHILSMTQTAESLQIHLKEMVDELGELATDSSMVVVEDELQAKIEAMQWNIKCIKSNVKKKMEELHLSDETSKDENSVSPGVRVTLLLKPQAERGERSINHVPIAVEILSIQHYTISCAQVSHLSQWKS